MGVKVNQALQKMQEPENKSVPFSARVIGPTLFILLAGGDKGNQRHDIALARELAQRI